MADARSALLKPLAGAMASMNPSQYTGPAAPPAREPHQQQAPRPGAHSDLLPAFLELLARQWRIVVGVPLVVLIVVVAALLMMPRRYTSSASFIVEAAPNGGMGGAMAIISQLNPNLAGGDSPKFYVDLVQSRPVLENLLALVPKERCGQPGSPTVLERLHPSGDTPLERLTSGVHTLADRVESSYDLRTGVIAVSVEADCPLLAKELTDSLIAAVNSFNVDRRQTRAKLRREFAEAQATEAEAALRAAEDQLAGFLATNRVIASPQLQLENDRLQRRVSMRNEVASTLRREASTARLDEINSMPALTVIDPPDTPIRASYPKRRVVAVAAAVLALALGIVAAILAALIAPPPPDASAAALRYHALGRSLLRSVRRR